VFVGGSGCPSCAGSCGGQSPDGCYCDDLCEQFGDCCPDYQGECVDAAAEIIIDNGDPGTSASGWWPSSWGVNPYGEDNVESPQPGATYTFETDVDGCHEVSLYWTSLCQMMNIYPCDHGSQVPVDIYDGDTLLDTVYVDQRENGGQWNVVGAYCFNGTARVVINSEGGYNTCADAVRFVRDPLQDVLPDFKIHSLEARGNRYDGSGYVRWNFAIIVTNVGGNKGLYSVDDIPLDVYIDSHLHCTSPYTCGNWSRINEEHWMEAPKGGEMKLILFSHSLMNKDIDQGQTHVWSEVPYSFAAFADQRKGGHPGEVKESHEFNNTYTVGFEWEEHGMHAFGCIDYGDDGSWQCWEQPF
jgi:hypothetical protein